MKIFPEKWIEQEYRNEGCGFWAVGLMGNHVVWYNDIEEGFNVSPFANYGSIKGYEAAQSKLHHLLSDITRYVQAKKPIICSFALRKPNSYQNSEFKHQLEKYFYAFERNRSAVGQHVSARSYY